MNAITETDWNNLCATAQRFEKLARKAGLLGGQISQAAAYSKYGRQRVNRWAKSGLVNPVKQHSRIYYSSDELTEASIQNQLS